MSLSERQQELIGNWLNNNQQTLNNAGDGLSRRREIESWLEDHARQNGLGVRVNVAQVDVLVKIMLIEEMMNNAIG